jgi:hypothetical protein
LPLKFWILTPQCSAHFSSGLTARVAILCWGLVLSVKGLHFVSAPAFALKPFLAQRLSSVAASPPLGLFLSSCSICVSNAWEYCAHSRIHVPPNRSAAQASNSVFTAAPIHFCCPLPPDSASKQLCPTSFATARTRSKVLCHLVCFCSLVRGVQFLPLLGSYFQPPDISFCSCYVWTVAQTCPDHILKPPDER